MSNESAQTARDALLDATRDFTEAFNRCDLDGVISHFAEREATYDQFNGEIASGTKAIREALVPQFRGDFGEMKFLEEDAFVDPVERKALIRWRCTLETKRGPASWRGLDILHFDTEGKISSKLTYAKAKQLALVDDVG
jgi:ketosteroid isomerase-like protein